MFLIFPFFIPARVVSISPVNAPNSQVNTPIAKNMVKRSTRQIEGKADVLQGSSTLQKYVHKQSIAFGINPALTQCIVTHESQWVPDKIGPEKDGWVSQGLWQIYQKAWPDITQAQAFDPVWSTNWALTQIKNGHVRWWATYSAPPYYCLNIPVFL